MIWEHSAFDPGCNKIYNITRIVRVILEGIALPASSLTLPGTTGNTLRKHRSSVASTEDDPGNDITGRGKVEPR
jgi:methyl coenzyme M reductase subunit D